jgi:hypothetical protein
MRSQCPRGEGQCVDALPLSAAQAGAMTSLGDLPQVVLSQDHRASPYAEWQRDLTQLSLRGRQSVASGSEHWIHLDDPELVIQAIQEVVVTVRSDSLVPRSHLVQETPQHNSEVESW